MTAYQKFVPSVIAYVIGALGIVSGAEPQPARPSFSIAVAAPQAASKLGDRVTLSLTFKNESGEKISFLRSPAPGQAEVYLDVDVRDAKGNPVPEGKYYRALKGKAEAPQPKMAAPGFIPPALVGGSRYRQEVPPGETWKDEIVINDLVELTKAGKYTITLSRIDPDTKAVARSNTITLTVTD